MLTRNELIQLRDLILQDKAIDDVTKAQALWTITNALARLSLQEESNA